ncbi:MAG: hypothetical protein KF878_16720 [Planctomycetes bacterium]|nr:hypothetical protein [Planctomycetota bacterium]
MRARELLLLAALGLTACRSARCEVHGDPLIDREVPVVYGLMGGDYLDARDELFPRADALGGCVVDPDRRTTVRAACATCVEVARHWRSSRLRTRSFHGFEEREPPLDGR